MCALRRTNVIKRTTDLSDQELSLIIQWKQEKVPLKIISARAKKDFGLYKEPCHNFIRSVKKGKVDKRKTF